MRGVGAEIDRRFGEYRADLVRTYRGWLAHGGMKPPARDWIEIDHSAVDSAEDALALGDTDTAKAKAAEARALYAQAEEKLDDAQSHIDRGESSARRRKPRQCDHGDLQVGNVREFKVWDTICDIGFSPQGTSLQEWTRQKENADSVLEGIQRFLDLLDIFGDRSPIAGPITPDAGEAAEAIVNAHLKLFEQRFPFDVWADVKGHTEWRRTDRLCERRPPPDSLREGRRDLDRLGGLRVHQHHL